MAVVARWGTVAILVHLHGVSRISGRRSSHRLACSSRHPVLAPITRGRGDRRGARERCHGDEVAAKMPWDWVSVLATISHLQEEIAKLGSELDALKLCVLVLCVCVCVIGIGTGGAALLVLDVMAPKSTEDIEREEFLRQMLEMNARIRQFQQKASAELAERCSGPPSADGKQGKSAEGQNVSDMNETMDSEGMLTDSADQMNKMNAEVHVLEEEYQKDLLELEKRVAELENVHNSLAEELQKRYICPGCGTNNMAPEQEEAAPAAAVAN
uniref:Uncharacterized protein n=1 Tax=Aegilops tauschii TaxID=37682 RepID=M8BNS5_AEGTA